MGKIQLIDAETLYYKPLEHPKMLIDGVLSDGLAIMAGDSKIGKSWMVLWMCLQISKGEPVWGLPTRKTDVVYLALEDREWRVQQRMQDLTDTPPDNLHFGFSCGQLGAELESQIEDVLKDYPSTGLLFIDTLQMVRDNISAKVKDHFYYACKHRLEVDGHHCDYRRQWTQEKINGAVEEVIKKLVDNPRFEAAMREKIDAKVNTSELDSELDGLRKKLRQLIGAKDKLAQKLDNLDIMDPHYSKKYDDMQSRLDSFYDEIDDVEETIDALQERIVNIRSEKITSDNIYQFLQFYGTMYDSFTDAEKKEFMKTFIEKVEIYKEPLSNGQLLKKITFAFPVFYNGEELREISWDEKFTGETVCLLVLRNPVTRINIDVDVEELVQDKRGQATYPRIKEYVLEQTGLKVSSLYISQIKRKCGLDVGESYNKPKSEDAKVPQCPPEKEKAIMDALRHFGLI